MNKATLKLPGHICGDWILSFTLIKFIDAI